MFCYHCQEAKKNLVCDKTGICGKKEDVSSLQDLLMFSLKGLAYYCNKSNDPDLVSPQTDRFMTKALFSMVTNINFAADDFVQLITETVKRKNHIRDNINPTNSSENDNIPEEANWEYSSIDEKAFIEKGQSVGVEKDKEHLDQDIHALQECLLYSVKGLGSLAVHQKEIGIEHEENYHFIYKALNFCLNTDNDIESVLKMALNSGELGLLAMHQLEQSNSKKFGSPEPTRVYLDTWENPGILVSGNDLQDIEDLLEQTKDTGIDIYTHGEAIIAHSYPKFKKYFNLVANFGGSWYQQKTEFPKFNGPILVTSHGIQQPKKTYEAKLYSTGMVSWPNIPYIADRKPGQRKDFSQIIEQAKNADAPTQLTEGQCITGYGIQALTNLTDQIIQLLDNGKIKRIIVIAGIDGRHKERSYYQELAESLPEDCIILTAGDTKFRYLSHEFGEIEGLPRLLDTGQCSDFAVIIQFLQHLQKKLNLNQFNQLPVSYNIAWYEQKTLLIILGLLNLNVQNLRVGPTLPPFFTDNIKNLLADKFQLKGIDNVENDIAAMITGN